MGLNKQQIQELVQYIAGDSTGDIDCDECFKHVAEFAETRLAGKSPCTAMKVIERHIEHCGCCHDEFQLFIEALKQVYVTE